MWPKPVDRYCGPKVPPLIKLQCTEQMRRRHIYIWRFLVCWVTHWGQVWGVDRGSPGEQQKQKLRPKDQKTNWEKCLARGRGREAPKKFSFGSAQHTGVRCFPTSRIISG